MKAFFSTLCIALTAFLVPRPSGAQEMEKWAKERASVQDAAKRSIADLLKLLSGLSEESFSTEGIPQSIWLDKIEVQAGTPRINALRQQIQVLIARIDLAQDFPETIYKGPFTVEEFLQNNDYFGVAAAHDLDGFNKKQALIERLFADRELALGNRFFGLMQTGKASREETFAKWIQHIERMAGPYYLGTTFERQPTTLVRSLVGLTILRGVVSSSHFQEILKSQPDLREDFEEAFEKLKKSAVHFARERYQRGGMLRDWCLPVASAVSRLYPDQTWETMGITSMSVYKENSLAHARAVTQLARLIDDPLASPKEAGQALQTIQSYRSQSFYAGSLEIRENGTLKVPPHQEVETLLLHASFFGPDGNINIKTCQTRSEQLDKLFIDSRSENNLALLVGLKSPDQWISFFEEKLLGGKKRDKHAVFPSLGEKRLLTLDHLKVLFLARAVLPSQPFLERLEGNEELKLAYQDLMLKFGNEVKSTASEQFRNFPNDWTHVQNGFLEIAKGFPEHSFDRLKVTTSNDLKMVRKGFEESLYGSQSIANKFLSLLLPESPNIIPSIDHMTSEQLSRRTGKFDKRLSPEFVSQINAKLDDLLEYRNYGLAAIDTLDRPDLQVGRIMTHFAVNDFRMSENKKTNTVMHDLICGREGGFGGLGVIFKSDAKGYREIESVLDAIATAEGLKLGETLFMLATDVNRDSTLTDKELADAARRWITYFRKSQANAQFNSVPEVITEAIRGTFLSRLVFQSDGFQRVLEKSKEAAVGSELDISDDFEAAVAAQVRKMQSILSKIDPQTASNRNLQETAESWKALKVWHLESTKWLEAVMDDPLMISEVARVRQLKRKTAEYQDICPEVLIFKESLEHSEAEIAGDGSLDALSLARFAMEQVTELEPDLNLPLPAAEGNSEDEERRRQLEFGKAVSSQFLNDVRDIVKKAGFEKLANVNDSSQIKPTVDALVAELNAKPERSPAEMEIEAKAMREAFQTAASKAISRVEAEQPSDFRTLAEQTVRAAKVDQLLTSQLQESQRIPLVPSLILREWVDRHRVEVMSDYRSKEITSEARHMINLAKEQRRSLIKIQAELEEIKSESIQKSQLLQKWIDQSNQGANVEAAAEEVLAMHKEVAALKKEVSELKDSEALMRSRAAEYAQLLFQYKRGGPQSIERREQSLIAEANRSRELDDPGAGAVIVDLAETAPPPVAVTKKKPSYASSRSRSSGNSSMGFFQRLFGRRN